MKTTTSMDAARDPVKDVICKGDEMTFEGDTKISNFQLQEPPLTDGTSVLFSFNTIKTN